MNRTWPAILLRIQLSTVHRPSILGLFGIAISVCMLGTVWSQPPPAPVAVAPVVQQEVASEQSFVGTVMPLRGSVVGSAVAGRVVEFFVNEGDRVTEGQPLAQLLTESLKIELAAAQAEADFRQATLEELENGTRPAEIAQAKARMIGAQAALEYARSRYKRSQDVERRNAGAISREDLDEARSLLLQAEQSYLGAKSAHDLAVEGPRNEQILQARAQLRVQQERAKQIEDRIAKHTVRAPFDGFVVAEHTEKGAWVSDGNPVAEVVQLDPVEIQVQVPETYISGCRPGTATKVMIDAFPDRTFLGKVTHVVPKADPRARTFPVNIRVENPLNEGVPVLKAGLFARVGLPVGKPAQAMLVPKDAIVLGGKTPLVMVVDPPAAEGKGAPSTVRPVPVQLGTASGDRIQIIGDMQPADLVVVKGNERLRPGQAVRVLDEPRVAAADE